MGMRYGTVGGIAAWAALGIAGTTHAGDACSVKRVDYRGWKCVELTNGRMDVIVAPDLGGRIIQLRLGDVEYLWNSPELTGKVVRYVTGKIAKGEPAEAKPPDWANYGGDKLWPAPQGTEASDEWPGPPDPAAKGGTVDNGKYRLEVIDTGPKAAAVRLTSPKDLYAGIRFIREIRIRPRSTTVDLEATMSNITHRRAVRWGIWQVTQHGGHVGKRDVPLEWDPKKIDVHAWSPINPKSAYAKGYRVMFGLKDNPQWQVDLSFLGEGGPKLFRFDYRYQVGKVGIDNAAGWLAVTHERSGYLFAHTFPPMANQEHPDGASVEFWASGSGEIEFGGEIVKMSANEPVLIESEVLSPYAELGPGQSFSYATAIHLARGKGPVANVTPAWAELEPIRIVEGGTLAGKIAAFHDGELEAECPRGEVGLGRVEAGGILDVTGVAKKHGLRDVKELRLVSPDGRRIHRVRF